jgi:hypothetical protein
MMSENVHTSWGIKSDPLFKLANALYECKPAREIAGIRKEPKLVDAGLLTQNYWLALAACAKATT